MFARLAKKTSANAFGKFTMRRFFSSKNPVIQNTTAFSMRNLLEYARYAPSPHNMQPWLFRVDSDTQTTLMYDPKRLLPDTNPDSSYVVVGFGMMIETMSIACAELSQQKKRIEVEFPQQAIKLDSSAETPQCLGKIHVVDNPVNYHESKPKLGITEILNRRTSRQQYDGQPVADSFLNGELSEVAAQFNHTMESSSQKAEVNWVVSLNAEAMLSDMSQEKTRYEIRNWLRYSQNDAEKKGDGLAAYTMNTSPWKLWLLVNGNCFLRLPGIYQWARNTYQQTMNGTATVAWLSGPFANFHDWINAGRMMMRWWLTMTKQGYYLHPFGSIITNPPAFQKMNQRFPNLSPSKPIWMVARIGKNKDDVKPPQAQRLPMEKMIMSDASQSGFFSSSTTTASDLTHTAAVKKPWC